MNKNVAKFAQSLTIFLIFIAALYRSGKIVESDVFWQARAGLDWLNDFTIIKNDLWSYVPSGEWIPNSWGWNVVLGHAYKLSPSFGLFALGFIVTSTFLTLIVLAARRLASSWNSINHTLAVVLIFSLPILSLRPALISAFAVLIMMISTNTFFRVFEKRPVVMTTLFLIFNAVMINLHLSWPAFLAAGFIGWAGLLFTTLPYKKTLSTLMPLGLAALVGMFLNPIGLKLYQHIFFTVSSSRELIYEWRPIWKEPLYILGVLLALAQIIPARKFKRIRPWAATSIAFAMMGIIAIRFIPWSLLFAVPTWSFWIRSWKIKKDKFLSLAAVGLAIALIPISIEAVKLHGNPFYLDDLKALPENCHLLSTPLPAGAVVLFRPDIKIFVDGRNDYWGKDRYKLVSDISKKPNDDLLEAIEPTCALVEKNSALSEYFRYQRSWEMLKVKNSSSSTMEVWSFVAMPQ